MRAIEVMAFNQTKGRIVRQIAIFNQRWPSLPSLASLPLWPLISWPRFQRNHRLRQWHGSAIGVGLPNNPCHPKLSIYSDESFPNDYYANEKLDQPLAVNSDPLKMNITSERAHCNSAWLVRAHSSPFQLIAAYFNALETGRVFLTAGTAFDAKSSNHSQFMRSNTLHGANTVHCANNTYYAKLPQFNCLIA